MIKKMVSKKSWQQFRSTGLLLFVNQILHIFGWAICYDFDDKNKFKEVYPARVKFRGFSEKSVLKSYLKISNYLSKNIKFLLKEAKDD